MPTLRMKGFFGHIVRGNGKTVRDFQMNEIGQRTSNTPMRVLLAAIALTVYGLTAGIAAFACPFMTTAAASHEEPCSDCPKQESCPPSACVLICQYTVENTAVVTSCDEHNLPFVSGPFPVVLHIPSLTRVHVPHRVHTRDFDSNGLYLRNRVLLI
jgi:hypothetical protein